MKRILVAFVMATASLLAWAKPGLVTSGASDGDGTLRAALAAAEDGDVIAVGCSRVFLTNQLEIAEGRFGIRGLTIEGNGVTLDGQDLCRILCVGADNKVVIRNANLENGHGPDRGQGGAVYNLGDLSIVRSTIRNNGVYVGYTRYSDHHSGSGGAFYNKGTLRIEHATATGNVTSNSGGVLFNEGGEAIFSDVAFSDNSDGKAENGAGFWGIYSEGGRLALDNVCFTGACVTASNTDYGSIVRAKKMDSVAFTACTFSDNCGSNNYPIVYLESRDFEMVGCTVSNNQQIVNRSATGYIFGAYVENATVSNVVFSNCDGGFSLTSSGSGVVQMVGSSFISGQGGEAALSLSGDNISVDRCDFESNVFNGGAVMCSSCSNLLFSNSRFVSNRALSGVWFGGRTMGCGAITPYTITIDDSTISNCLFASNVGGKDGCGAVGWFPQIVGCVFSNNVSACGGASGGGCIRNSLFVGNAATNGYGGAVYCGTRSFYLTARLDHCEFRGNTASLAGGAVSGHGIEAAHCSFVSNTAVQCGGAFHPFYNKRYVDYGETRGWNRIVIGNCAFLGNVADYGGAIGCDRSGHGMLSFSYNCVFSGNRAASRGSAASGNSGFNFIIANSSFMDNGGDCLSSGSGILAGVVTAKNGTCDYFHEPYAYTSRVLFSVLSGLISDYYDAYATQTFGLSAADVDRDVVCSSAGEPEMSVDTGSWPARIYFSPRADGEFPGRGVFLWHDERWNNVAYSMAKNSKRHALYGDAEEADICVGRDYLGNEIRYPACAGAVYSPARRTVRHTVSFDAQGGSDVESRLVENGMCVGDLPTSEREGYWLYGWYADAACRDPVDLNTQIVTSRTFYARWIPDEQPDGGPYPQIVDGVEWTYFVSNGVARVSAGNSTSAITNRITGRVVVPATLGGHVVREIGDDAFYGCSLMTSVVIPDTVTHIAESAFSGCRQLTYVAVPASVVLIARSAFLYCSKMTTVRFYGPLPTGVAASCILTYATAVYYPRAYALEYAAVVPSEIFVGYVDEGGAKRDGSYVEAADGYTWHYDVMNGEATIVRTNRWGSCIQAVLPTPHGRLRIPDTLGGCPVVGIGNAAFSGTITNLCIGASMRSLAADAFRWARVSGIELSLDNADLFLFEGSLFTHDLTKLLLVGKDVTALALPAEMVSDIPAWAFEDCIRLDALSVDEENARYAIRDGLLYDTTADCVLCASRNAGEDACEVPAGTRGIRKSAFEYANYSHVALPESLRFIEDYAFYGCENLSDIRLPSGLEYVGTDAFRESALWTDRTGEAEAEGRTCPVVVDGWLLGCSWGEPVAAAFTVPDGVRALADNAIDSSDVRELILPAGLDLICRLAFNGGSLERICFKGSAPSRLGASSEGGVLSYSFDILATQPEDAVCCVRENAEGWTNAEGELPGYWPLDPDNAVRTDDARALRYWTSHAVVLRVQADAGAWSVLDLERGRVYALPRCTATPPSGKRFAGWACSNGRRYDDGCLVFNLAEPGETVTMTAIWE